MMVTNWTLDSNGRLAMKKDLLANTLIHISHARFHRHLAVWSCSWPLVERAVNGVAALPISIWPEQMSYCRPSKPIDLKIQASDGVLGRRIGH